jgi:hypothetical protein
VFDSAMLCEELRLSKFRTFIISPQNYAGSRQELYKMSRMKLFATLGKEKPNRKYTRLKLAGGQADGLSSD